MNEPTLFPMPETGRCLFCGGITEFGPFEQREGCRNRTWACLSCGVSGEQSRRDDLEKDT